MPASGVQGSVRADQADGAHGKAGGVGEDLGDHRGRALADVLRALVQDDLARGRDAGADRRGVRQRGVAATVPARGDADPPTGAASRAAAFQCRLPARAQRLEAVGDADAAGQKLARCGRVAVAESVEQPEIEPVDPGGLGKIVHQRLGQAGGLRHAEAAEGARDRPVRVHGAALGAEVRHAVGAGGVHGDAVGDRRTPRGIGAGVDGGGEVHGDEAAAPVAAGTGLHAGGMALGGRLHRLGAGVDHPRWAAGPERDEADQRLQREVELGAEAAARRRWQDADAAGRQAQHRRRLGAVHRRRLGAGVDHQHAAPFAGLEPGGAGLGLDIGVLDMRGPDLGLGAVRGRGQPGGGIAAADKAADQQVARPLLVQQDRAWCLGLDRVEEVGQRRPGDGEAGEVERGDPIGLAGDQRHRLAAEAGGGLGQRRLVGERRDDAEAVAAGDVGGGEDRLEPLRQAPGVEVAKGEAGMVVRRARGANGEPAPPFVSRPKIGAERVSAANLGRPVQPLDRRADGTAGRGPGVRSGLGPGVADRIDDLGIAGAAAEHAAERFPRLGPGRARGARQERGGRHQHAGRADAALRRAVPQEGALQAVRLAGRNGRQPLDGGDLAADGGGGGRQAGADRLAVQQHRAGAAVAAIAADLGAGQVQRLAQHIREPPRRVDAQGSRHAVHGQMRRGRVEAHAGTRDESCASIRRISSAAACAR